MINICIPTLNAYKELEVCIESLNKGSVIPDKIHVIDNGGNFSISEYNNVVIYPQPYNLGVAGSWNWFIQNIDETRIISNDDIEFSSNALEELVKNHDESFVTFPIGIDKINSFSCFLLPNNIVNSVGLFDEWISPNYGYFEDNDYHRRMRLLGFDIRPIESAGVIHVGSSTLKNFSPYEEKIHHERFRAARDRYIQKWGGLPGEEKFLTPFGK